MKKNRWAVFFTFLFCQVWTLLLPVYGDAFKFMVQRSNNVPEISRLLSVLSYFATVAAATYFVKALNVRKLLFFSIPVCLGLSLVMWAVPSVQVYYFVYLLLGISAGVVSSAAFYIYVYALEPGTRVRFTSTFLLCTYFILYMTSYLERVAKPLIVFLFSSIVLVVALLPAWFINIGEIAPPRPVNKNDLPVKLMFFAGVVVFVIYFNNALMVDFVSASRQFYATQPVAQVAALIVLFIVITTAKWFRHFMAVYTCLIMTGIMYMTEVIRGIGHYHTAILSELVGVFSSLFILTFTGDLAFKYGRNFRTFRWMWLISAAGLIAGGIPAGFLDSFFSENRILLYYINLILLFISFLLIPWLAKYMNDEMKRTADKDNPDTYDIKESFRFVPAEQDECINQQQKLEFLNISLPEDNRLTNRELEIAGLLLERYDYLTIANRLFITRNTVKGHVSNIYQKLNVSRKSEFIEFVENMEKQLQQKNADVTKTYDTLRMK